MSARVCGALLAWCCACAATSPQPAPPTARAPLATWVWTSRTVLDDRERAALLSFARERAVDTVYVQLSPVYEAEGWPALLEMIRAAGRHQLRVFWVDGAPDWVSSAGQERALAALARAARLNRALEAAGVARVAGVLCDVEPYLLEAWKNDRARVLADFELLSERLQRASQAASLELWWTLPFWFAEHAGPKAQLLVQRSDGVVIMAYRNRPEQVVRAARSWLRLAEPLARPVVVAVETQCIEPSYISFCGTNGLQLSAALADIRRELGTSPAFAGLAVHQYSSWRQLGAAR